jgi:hypothetical protein
VLILHLEIQARPQRRMAVRMLLYTALLWNFLIETRAVAADEPLPLVLPLVLHHGEGRWSAPTTIADLLPTPIPPLLDPYIPRHSYLFLDEQRTPLPEPFVGLVQAFFALARTGDLLQQAEIAAGIRRQLSEIADQGQDLIDLATTWWATSSANADLPAAVNPFREDTTVLSTTIKQFIDSKVAEGRAEGEARGEARGLLASIHRRLQRGRLTPDEARAEILDLRDAGVLDPAQAVDALAHLG